jgi:hypothetical protein
MIPPIAYPKRPLFAEPEVARFRVTVSVSTGTVGWLPVSVDVVPGFP